MSNLTLTIGGRTHVVSVPDGEEAHIEQLGAMIEERVRKLGLQQQTETRMLLFAALVLADEIANADKARPAPPPPPPLPPPPPPPADPVSPEMVARIEALAARVEKLAARLEQSDEAP